MTFRKPFKAVPVRPAARYQRSAAARREGVSLRGALLAAALGGLAIGTGSVATTPEGRAAMMAQVKPVAVPLGLMRARAPQQGDYWPGCNAARAAGTAPIYRGEPGYRERMDGDDDGVACEPYY